MIQKRVNMKQLALVVDSLPRHADESVRETLNYWCQKILIRHFQYGNATAYGYKLLSVKYAARKAKKWGNKPILVASGRLRDDATSKYKVYRLSGKFRVVLDVPEFGKYVRDVRDYTLINKRDKRDLNRFWKSDMNKRRKAFVRQLR